MIRHSCILVDVQFRILGEGLPIVLPFVDPSTIVVGNLATLKALLVAYFPRCDHLQEPFKSMIEAQSKLASFHCCGSSLTLCSTRQSCYADTA